MSTTESNEIIAETLKMGAINFMVKPVRIQQCKALAGFMKNKNQLKKPEDQDREIEGVERFEQLQELGRGAVGIVHLVKDKYTGVQFAMKTMNLDNLTDKEKRSALDEVEFLRVITGPTIIKFIESFNENSKLYIIMELADGGSLSDLIQKHRLIGKKFTTD